MCRPVDGGADGGRRSGDHMRYSGTWLTPADEAVLEQLREAGPSTPAELAGTEGLDYGRTFVEERCAMLAGRGRLVAFADGRYALTDRGRAYLDGELDPDELERA